MIFLLSLFGDSLAMALYWPADRVLGAQAAALFLIRFHEPGARNN